MEQETLLDNNKIKAGPGQVVQWVGASSGTPKRLLVRFPVGAHMRGNLWMFLSYTDVSLSLPAPPKINKHTLGWKFKKLKANKAVSDKVNKIM